MSGFDDDFWGAGDAADRSSQNAFNAGPVPAQIGQNAFQTQTPTNQPFQQPQQQQQQPQQQYGASMPTVPVNQFPTSQPFNFGMDGQMDGGQKPVVWNPSGSTEHTTANLGHSRTMTPTPAMPHEQPMSGAQSMQTINSNTNNSVWGQPSSMDMASTVMGAMFNQNQQNNGSNPNVNLAMNIGMKVFENSGFSQDKLMSWVHLYLGSLRPYFTIDTSTVIESLYTTLFPYPKLFQMIKGSGGGRGDGSYFDLPSPTSGNAHQSSQSHHNVLAAKNDLYTPVMALITFVLFSAIAQGRSGSFTPEVFGSLLSSSLVLTVLLVVILKAASYLFGLHSVALLDLSAMMGRIFVFFAIAAMSSLFISSGFTSYVITLTLIVTLFVHSIVRIVPVLLFEPNAHLNMGGSSNHSKKKNAYVVGLVSGLLQMLAFFILTPSAVSYESSTL